MQSLLEVKDMGCNYVTWVHVRDLPWNKPLLVLSCTREKSKYDAVNGCIVVDLKDVGKCTLPSRFKMLSDEALVPLNSGTVYMIVKKSVGQTSEIVFSDK